MGAYIIRRLLWTLLLLWVVSGITLHRLQRPAERRPGAAARRAARAEPEIIEAHPRDLRARPAALRPVLGLHQGRLPAVRLRRAPTATTSTCATQLLDRLPEHAVPGRRRRRRLADRRPHGRHDLRRQARLVPRPLRDDARRSWRSRRRSTGSASSSLYLFSDDIGRFPILPGLGRLPGRGRASSTKAEALIMPWCVLATAFAAIYARLLRANLLEVDGRGLHPHRAGQGPVRAARDLPPRRCARR